MSGADDLFEAHAVVRKRDGIIAGSSGVTAGSAMGSSQHGFSGAQLYFAKATDLSGHTTFSAQASIMQAPLHAAASRVWWEVRDFYYNLGFSIKSFLARYLRKRSTVARMHDIHEFFELDPSLSFAKSRKQALACGDVGEAHLFSHHDTEIMASTPWMFSFLLMHARCRVPAIKLAAEDLFKNFASLAKGPVPVLVAGGEALPPCLDKKLGEDLCPHMQSINAKMQQCYGMHWRQSRHVEFIWKARISACPALDVLVFQTYWQLADMVDATVIQRGATGSSDGMPVLMAGVRARRMTKHWMTQPHISVACDVRQHRVYSASAVPRVPDSSRREGLGMCNHHALISEKMAPASHIALAVDAVSTPSETLNTAVALPLDGGFCFWMPVQVTMGKHDFH